MKNRENSAKDYNIVRNDFKRTVTQSNMDDFEKDEYNAKLMSKVSGYYRKCNRMSLDEARQLSLMALWQAIGTYEEDKNIKFCTHLYRCLTYTFKSHIRYKPKVSKTIPNNIGQKIDLDLILDLKELKNMENYHIFEKIHIMNESGMAIGNEFGYSDMWVYNKNKNFKREAKKFLSAYE